MLNLFFTFFKIGILTFGGGYAMIPMISEEILKFGITPYTLSNFIAISESTPGPFAINMATFIGYNSYGILGSVIATLGVILPSFIIMLLISIFIKKVRNTNFFKTFLTITTPIVLGLILSSTIKISSLNLFNISSFETIKTDFALNITTLVTFLIILTIFLFYLIRKKEKLSPFKIISLSFICGFTSYLFHLL